MMIVFGFMLLYVVPFAFRYQYWGIFLGLINATLLGMVMGLATVASILQGKIEKLMLHALMWRGASRYRSPSLLSHFLFLFCFYVPHVTVGTGTGSRWWCARRSRRTRTETERRHSCSLRLWPLCM